MKKRIISMLLTVLMVMSLFSGLTVSAQAATTTYGANTIEYTMANGDYVLRICQKLGLNYYTCKQAIMILNHINEGQWSKLPVGTVLTLPASDQDAILIANGAYTSTYSSGSTATTGTISTTGTATTGTATTGTATAVTTSSIVNNGNRSSDILAFYLVPYTMSAGETVSGVCNNLGVNFSIFQDFIRNVNGISSWNKVRAGQTLIIPTPVCPAVGTTCYGVMRHVVAASDTAYTITSAAGVNYNANKKLLEALNQTTNLSSIKVGENFYYPLPMTVSVPGSSNAGSTASTTTTVTVTDGNGSTTTTTTTTSKLYKLNSGMSASDGTMLFYVDSKAVTSAAAGAKVTVQTDTKSGKAIQSLTVKHADGKADLLLSGDSFIMPDCDVRVDATIKSGHDINIVANYSGKATASISGVSVQSAVKGAAVIIKSTDPNYEIENVYAYYKRFSFLSTKTALTITSNGFAMPDADVTVEVSLKPVTTYAFYVEDDTTNEPNFSTRWGSFFLEVNGAAATRAAKGAQVTIVPRALSGYEPFRIVVKQHNGAGTVNVFSNTFTMPGYDVDVWVYFAPKGNNIVVMPAQGGTAEAQYPAGTKVTDAPTGATVTLRATADTATPDNPINYQFDHWEVVRNSDGLKVSVNTSTSNPATFVMPEGGVTVTPVFVGAGRYDITAEMYINGALQTAGTYKDCSFYISFNDPQSTTIKTYTGEFRWTNAKASDAAVFGTKYAPGTIYSGTYLNLRDDSSEGVAFVKYEILVGGMVDQDLSNQATYHGYFLMPDGAVKIRAYFETGKVAIGPAAVTGVGTVSYQVNGFSAATCDPNDTVEIILIDGEGYYFDYTKQNSTGSKLIVTRKDNGAPIALTYNSATNTYSFKMPAEGVNIQAIFDPAPYILTFRTVNEITGAAQQNLTGLGIWQIFINGVGGVVDNDITGTKVEVAYGDNVVVSMTEAGYSEYDLVSFRINGKEYVADVLNYFYNFAMVDERAQNLDIVATVRPRVPYSPIPHALNAIYDASKGNVEFLIVESQTHYSDGYRFAAGGGGDLVYVTGAFYGDTVAMICQSTNFKVDENHIWIQGGDADRIIPTYVPDLSIYLGGPATVPPTPGWVFTMPETDVSISVNFYGEPLTTTVNVVDISGLLPDTKGMVRLSVNGGERDVASPSTFYDINYKDTIYINRTELANTEGYKITGISIVGTGTGNAIPYADWNDGYSFTMPNEGVNITVTIDKDLTKWPITLSSLMMNGTLSFYDAPKGSGGNIIFEAKPGQTVYVYDNPSGGYEHLGINDLKILKSDNTNIAQWNATVDPPVPGGVNQGQEWSFEMPNGGVSFNATFEKVKYTLSIVHNGFDITIMKNGSVQTPITAGTHTIIVSVGDNITITPANSGNTIDTTTYADLNFPAPGTTGAPVYSAASWTWMVPSTLVTGTVSITNIDII